MMSVALRVRSVTTHASRNRVATVTSYETAEIAGEPNSATMSTTRSKSMSPRLRAMLIAFIAFAVPTNAAGEVPPVRTYGVADGLPQEGVKRIVRDSRGFLWFCTFDGLSRFDGTRFVNYGVRDGLPHPSPNQLLESRSGVYWVATNGGGVARFDPTMRLAPAQTGNASSRPRPATIADGPPHLFTPYGIGETAASSRVNVLHEDRAGRLWAGTDDGLFVVDDPAQGIEFRQIDLPFGRPLHVRALIEDRAGSLWVGTGEGLARRWPDGRTEIVRVDSSGKVTVFALAEDHHGQLWIGLSSGVRVVRTVPGGTEWTASGVRDIDGWISGFLESGGLMWISTFAGDVFAADGNGVRRELHAEYAFTSLADDREGNLWVSAMRGRTGAIKLVRRGFVRFDERDGLTKGLFGGIFETKAGDLCVVWQGRLHQFDGHRFIDVTPVFDRPVTIRTFLQDRGGETWFSTDRGLYRFITQPTLTDLARVRLKARYATNHGLPTDDVVLTFEDSRGDIWIGTREPTAIVVIRRESNQLEVFSVDRGLPAASTPTAIVEDLAGNIWAAFREGGVLRYRHGRFEQVDDGHGLARSEVLDLLVDRTGRLWAAGPGALRRVDAPAAAAPSFVRYTTAEGLTSDVVRCLTEDEWGRVYAGTTRGVDRLDPASGRIIHYSTADGLAQDELQRAFRDRHGVLWFVSWGGVSRLVPEPDRNLPAPPVFISGVRAGGDRYPISEIGERTVASLTLRPDEAQVAIDFFGLDVADGDRLRFEYRLDGADLDWNPPTTERTVNYAHLSPGAYRFQVRAVTSSGSASEPASLSFRILPPIWLRSWFIGCAFALLAGLGTLLYRYRVAQLLAVERVRTRIATDLHDDIGASLSQIAILSELVRGETDTHPESANTLGRIASISRDLVESMGDIVWAINPRRDRVSDLLQRMRHFASDTLTGKDIDFNFQTPELGRELALAADVRREVLLIFKEAVNNIVQHARCRHVDIDVRIDREGLVLRVADDGDGVRLASDRPDGHGLSNMRERAARLAGSLEVGPTSSGGTTVLFRVPLRRSPHTYLRA
jgi:ligand-binding sensor domain-containing protein/two-component sensor histidine kinase